MFLKRSLNALIPTLLASSLAMASTGQTVIHRLGPPEPIERVSNLPVGDEAALRLEREDPHFNDRFSRSRHADQGTLWNDLTQRMDRMELGWVNYFGSNSLPSPDFMEGACLDGEGNVIVVGTSDFQCLTIKYSPDGTELWRVTQERNGDVDTYGRAVEADPDGNIYVTGFTGGPHDDADLLLLKYDAAGSLLWSQSYDGEFSQNDIPVGLVLDEDQHVYVSAQSQDETLTPDFLLVKYDASGAFQWAARHNGTGYAGDYITDMAIDSAGEVYISGIANQDISGEDIMVIKYDSEGNQLFRTTYDAQIEDADWPLGMTLDDSGRVYVTGVSAGYDGLFDFVTFKLNPDGSGAWSRRHSSDYITSCYAFDIAVDSLLNVYIVGVDYYEPTGFDMVTIKYDPLGNTAWTTNHSSPIDYGVDQGTHISVDFDQNILVMGISESTDGTDDLSIVKYDSLGNQTWGSMYASDPPGDEFPERMLVSTSNDVIIASQTHTAENLEDFLLLKLDGAGSLLWDAVENGPGNHGDAGLAIATDGLSNIYVAGVKYSVATEADITLFKYDSTGVLLWATDWNGEANAMDMPADMLVDDLGNIIVAGYSETSSAGRDMLVQMYSPDGDLIWMNSYDGPSSDDDEAMNLALDPDGHVFISGYSSGNFTNADFTVIKYDALGNELWVARYVGPNYGSDIIHDMILDDAGNVYVTGSSYRMGFNQDFATVKYDHAGNEIWVKRYNGPVNLNDEGNAIGLDGSGNVYVTGSSLGSDLNLDFTTIKYSAAGNEQWVQRYDGSGHFTDEAMDMVVTRNGEVIVGGQTMSETTDRDVAIVAYSSAGNEEWVNVLSSAGEDAFVDLVRDATGAIYVLEQLMNGETSMDYQTTKLDASGNVLWSIDQSGNGHSWDEPSKFLVDNRGTIWVTGSNHHFYFSGYDWSQIMTVQYLQPEYPVYVETILPTAFELKQNVPNPFNPSTAIEFAIPARGEVKLSIYDLQGRETALLAEGQKNAGHYSNLWNGVDRNGHPAAAGVYICKLLANNQSKSIKMVYLK
jgi:uncharacterized delta-60 repeat protein